MEHNRKWHDARKNPPKNGERVFVSMLSGEPFVYEETQCHWPEGDKYMWAGVESEKCYSVRGFPFWCEWPSINDEGCVG